MRVRACNTIVGFKCFGSNTETRPCFEDSWINDHQAKILDTLIVQGSTNQKAVVQGFKDLVLRPPQNHVNRFVQWNNSPRETPIPPAPISGPTRNITIRKDTILKLKTTRSS